MKSTLFSLSHSLKRFAASRKSVSVMGSLVSRNKKSPSEIQIEAPAAAMCTAPCSQYEESVVCQESDLVENQMKEFDINGKGKVLLVKQGGKLSAIGTKCSHYGAPLVTGALGNGRVRCPWHGACFNLATGDIEDFPGLDSVPSYQVSVTETGGVKVRAHRDHLAKNKRAKTMTKRDPEDTRTFIVVGAGAAGACCVETLRQEGFSGRLVFVGRERFVPYDRIKLSKALDATAEKLQLRTPQFYTDNDIEVKLATQATALNAAAKTVTLSSGETLTYDAIFLATGSDPRRGGIPGADLGNVCVLRSVEQANHIAAQLTPEGHLVVVGASFIGMEVATFCVGKVATVTVLVRDDVPFKKTLGDEVGARLMQLHQEKGVKFEVCCDVAAFHGKKSVEETELKDGRRLPSSVVILGIGSQPCTDFLVGSGLQLHGSGAVKVNEFLQSTEPGVYAGGDIAYAPVLSTTAAIGHWQLAHYHGNIAAHNMLGHCKSLQTVPYFWTVLFGKSIRYAGYAPAFDSVVVAGDLAALKFVAYYCTGDHVSAVATGNSDPIASKFAELLAAGKQLEKKDIDTWAK